MDHQLLKPSLDKAKEEHNHLVFSYLTLRNLIGFSGMLLPLVLAVFPKRPTNYYGFEPSISDYFHTDRGDILVVNLSVLAVFLFTYTGYNWKERILTVIAAISGLGVAFVPIKQDCDTCFLSVHTDSGGVIGPLFGQGMHLTFAAIFLLSLALMSLIFFPKTKERSLRKQNGTLTQKGKRNIVFKLCGWIIILSVVIMGLYLFLGINAGKFPVIFFFETIAVEAFAISWLTKGETLWPDGEHYVTNAYHQFKELLK